jgi:diacylglycerol kinase
MSQGKVPLGNQGAFGRRLASFRHAFDGAGTLLRTQPNARFHLVAALLVIVLGWALNVMAWEWAMLALAIGTVWTAEAMNTALEFLSDELSLEWREKIKHAKDVAAFGVLAASVAAMVTGGVIFGPRLIALIL